jgi:predicted nucleotidyltransferase
MESPRKTACGRIRTLNRERVIAALREHEPELKAAGIAHRALHGSYARGAEISAQSDVDVIAGFDRARKLSLIGRVHIENRLTDILGVKADLADRAMLLPEVLEKAQRELVVVFRTPPHRLFTDIADAIAMIRQFTLGMDFEASAPTRWPSPRSNASCR